MQNLLDVNPQSPIRPGNMAAGLVALWAAIPALRGGVKVYDLMNSAHATLNGTDFSFWQGDCFNPDGVNDYATTNAPALKQLTGDMTVFFDVQSPSTADQGPVILSNDYRRCVDIRLSSIASYFYCGNGSTYFHANMSFPGDVNTRMRVAWTREWDAVGLKWRFKGFFEGVLRVNAAPASTSIVASPYDMFLFSRQGPSVYWPGRVWLVGLWNRALSEQEVKSLSLDAIRGYPQLLNRPRKIWVAAGPGPGPQVGKMTRRLLQTTFWS